MRGPAGFRGGVLGVDLNLAAASQLVLRFRDPSGAMLFRADVATEGLTLIKQSGRRNDVLKKVPLRLAPGAWHRLTLRFDGPELMGELGETTFVATDAVFDHDKAALNWLVSGGVVGLRDFAITPTGAPAATGN